MTRRMTYPGAVIGIQARGLAGEEPPHASVEAMAAEYLREIKAFQPDGPYYLCGYSFGGLVAFEMARRLWESGDEVGLVGLFDTTMSPLRWPLRVWLSIVRRRLAQFAAGVSAAPIDTWPAAIRRAAGRVRDRLRGYSTPREQNGPAAQRFEGRAHPCSQGGDYRADRIGAVSARVLSRRTDAVQSGGAGTRPPVSPVDLAQTRSRSIHCRDRRRPLDDALRAQRRVHGRMLDAASSRVMRNFLLRSLTGL